MESVLRPYKSQFLAFSGKKVSLFCRVLHFGRWIQRTGCGLETGARSFVHLLWQLVHLHRLMHCHLLTVNITLPPFLVVSSASL